MEVICFIFPAVKHGYSRKLQRDIQKLRQLLKDTDALRNRGSDYCSETDTEGGEYSIYSSDSCGSPDRHKASASKIHLPNHVEEIDENAPLVSLLHGRKKNSFNAKMPQKTNNSCMPESSIRHTSKSDDNQLASGRKRPRIIVSDDESDEPIESDRSKRRAYESHVGNIVASDIGWFSKQLTSYLLKYSNL